MKKEINIYIQGIITSCLIGFSSYAQDVHFSQMEYSPLTLNPALAGANGSMNGAVNYRSQWKSVASPYKTIAASFDFRLNERKRQKKGIFAMGINFFNDQAGDAKISSTNVNLNAAYHLILNKKSRIGAGLYAGYGQRAISPGAGRWGSQFNGNNYDNTLPSGETFISDNFSYLDVGTGVVYSFKNTETYMTSNNQRDINAGFAVYHLSKPNYSFLSANDEQLYMRFSLFANATIGIENTRFSLMPGIYYQRQKTAQELLFGSYFRYMIQEESRITGFNKGIFLSLGAFYRNRDALVAKAMMEFADYSVGFAYDVNLSTLTTVSQTKGGFEIFLRYNLSPAFGGIRSRI